MTTSLRAQFEKERQLARLIYATPAAERPRAYYDAYKELYDLFPSIGTDDAEENNRVSTTMAYLAPFLGGAKFIVEVGAGRCHLVQELAKSTERVLAVDVARLADTSNWPPNLTHQLFDGLNIEVADGVADLVISDNVIEHLHPDDTQPQLREMIRILKPGGVLVVLTPNKINGPHDISAGFTKQPEGLHLKEYASLEMKAALELAGLSDIKAYVGFGGRYFAIPPFIGAIIEVFLAPLPRALIRRPHLRWLLPNRFTGRKPG